CDYGRHSVPGDHRGRSSGVGSGRVAVARRAVRAVAVLRCPKSHGRLGEQSPRLRPLIYKPARRMGTAADVLAPMAAARSTWTRPVTHHSHRRRTGDGDVFIVRIAGRACDVGD